MLKRIFDVGCASALLVICAPLMGVIAILIRHESAGPIIIATERVGRGGRHFAHYRFRTMAGTPAQKTPVGRLLGNCSLDDIPTLWNILRGDMSFVGPLPTAPEQVDMSDPLWQTILAIRPGLTSASLLALRAQYMQTAAPIRLRIDYDYACRTSFALDCTLIIRTLIWWLRMGHLKGRF